MKKGIAKKLLMVMMVVLGCFFLSGCGDNELSEKELIEILPAEMTSYEFEGVTCSVDSIELEIVRRKIEDTTDEVECEITMTDANMSRTIYVILYLSYYDVGGWQIDQWGLYQDEVSVAYVGPDSVLEEQEIAELGFTSFVKDSEDINLENGTYTGVYKVDESYTYATFSGYVYIYGTFVTNIETNSSRLASYGWKFEVNSEEVAVAWDVEGDWSGTSIEPHDWWQPDRFELSIFINDQTGEYDATGAYYYPVNGDYANGEGIYECRSTSLGQNNNTPLEANFIAAINYTYYTAKLVFTPDEVSLATNTTTFENITR